MVKGHSLMGKDMGSGLWLVDSTLELQDLPGSTPLSLMLPIHQRFDPTLLGRPEERVKGESVRCPTASGSGISVEAHWRRNTVRDRHTNKKEPYYCQLLVFLVFKFDVPMGSVTKGFVFRSSTSTQCVMLG